MITCPEGFKLGREGRATLCLPDPELYKRADGVYEPAWAPVFYNPVMVENRDLAIALLHAVISELPAIRVVEPLAGTGVRGIRMVLEVPDIAEVIMGDADERAVKLMEINAEINQVSSKIRIVCADANELLFSLLRQRIRVDYVDIDPFGSPAPFTYAAVSSVRRGGYVALTATDLAPLEGKYPQKLYRRYGVIGYRNIVSKEVAIRNLIAFTAREAAKIDRVIVPVFAYYSRHYIRVYVKVLEGGLRASEMLSRCIGSLVVCNNCGYVRQIHGIDVHGMERCPICNSATSIVRFTWVCKVKEPDVVRKVCSIIEQGDVFAAQSKKLAQRLALEAEIEGSVYRISAISRFLRRNMPSPQRVVECLQSMGYRAARSHLYHDGVVTDAVYEEVQRCVA